MTTYQIDSAHTQVGFSAKHMMITNVRGQFTQLEGEFELDQDEPTASHGEIRLAVASVETGFGARDTHLRSADFFDAEQFPTLTVRSTAIRHTSGNDYVVTADVTIRDVTKSVDFDVEFLGFYPGMDGANRAGLTATAKVDRKAWNLDWNVALEAGGWLVGNTIKLEADIAIQQVAVAAVAA